MTTSPEKSKYSENKSQSHFVHHRSHKDCSVIEPAPSALRGQRLTTWYGTWHTVLISACSALIELLLRPCQQFLFSSPRLRISHSGCIGPQCSLHYFFFKVKLIYS